MEELRMIEKKGLVNEMIENTNLRKEIASSLSLLAMMGGY